MKKTIVYLFLASCALSMVAAGCKSEAKVDEDGAKVEVEPKK